MRSISEGTRLTLEQEEIYWKQRSRVSWLKEEDRNTSYFHHKASQRRRRNAIKSLKLEKGEGIKTDGQIEQHIKEFYKKLFSSDGAEVELFADIIDQRLDDQMKSELMKDFSKQEIFDALGQMHPWKAPRPDGLHAGFYQRF